MTTNTPARPRGDTRAATAPHRREPAPHQATTAPHRREPPAPCEPTPADSGFSHPRVRGRHRKPRPRKVLLAAGGLALATGALSLLRLTSGPGADARTVEAGPRPEPVTTAADDAAVTAATFPAAPDASPSSPAALGGRTPSPATKGARVSPSTTTGTPAASTAAAAPAPTTIPDTPNPPNAPAPAPTAPGGHATRPDSAPTTPASPSRTTPAPAPPKTEESKKPHDPGLCVPVIGLCMDSPVDRR
ncbi:hypothetical protein ABT116_21300 [Streptomyces sp. NPDC002130]|uniref:hypothetical protein n=1 Tax=Streptomyces sp. NPDC002130 TaxID=3155568 RepID=UPI003328AF0E